MAPRVLCDLVRLRDLRGHLTHFQSPDPLTGKLISEYPRIILDQTTLIGAEKPEGTRHLPAVEQYLAGETVRALGNALFRIFHMLGSQGDARIFFVGSGPARAHRARRHDQLHSALIVRV